MKVLQFLFTAIILLNDSVHSKKISHHDRRLEPEEFGNIHNRICLQVRDRIARKTPQTKAEAFRYLKEELLTLCEDDDVKCQAYMHKVSVHSQFQNFRYRNYETIIDDAMSFALGDTELENTLKDIYFAIDLLDSMGVKDVQDILMKITSDFNDSDKHESKKHLVSTIASVAASSMELWMKTFSDPNDAFHKLLEDGEEKRLVEERGLQAEPVDAVSSSAANIIKPIVNNAGFIVTTTFVGVLNVIKSDVIGAVTSAIRPAIQMAFTSDFSGLNTIILGATISESIGAVLSFFNL